MESHDSLTPNPDNIPEALEPEKALSLHNESAEYKGKYQISNWDFEYAKEHYERDVIMAFHKSSETDYAIDKALDKIRQKLDAKCISIDWSKPIDIQEIVDLYREHTDDEKKNFYSVFEISGVFSIERLGYEELRDQILTKVSPHLHHAVDKIIKEAIIQKLNAWETRRRSIEI